MTAAACCPHCGLDPSAPPAEKPKGGPLARAAAMLCQDEKFRLYLDWRVRKKFSLNVPDGTHTEADARAFILKVCGVGSRAELDSNPLAAQWFAYIRKNYGKWRQWMARQQRGKFRDE